MSEHQTIGPYIILEELGEGSFGPVYRGRQGAQGQAVAIKVCSLEDTDLRQRFQQEGERAARLVHPNIVRTLSVGTAGTMPYLAQELVLGKSLGEVIERREDSTVESRLDALLEVARGLEYAHRQGLWHGDLKPDNIRRSSNGLKILDFGIARLATAETRLTQKGVTVDTASYLPPEQVRGGELDHRVDIFSFGVLAFELLTYERPFRGKTLSALVYQILYKDPTAIDSLWPECPPAVESMIGRCLAKDVDQRYGTIAEVIADLEAIRGIGKLPGIASSERTSPGARGEVETTRSIDTTQPIAAAERRPGAPSDTKPVVARPHETVRMRQIPGEEAVSTTMPLPTLGRAGRPTEPPASPPPARSLVAEDDPQKTQRIAVIPGKIEAKPPSANLADGAKTQRMSSVSSSVPSSRPSSVPVVQDLQKTQRVMAIPEPSSKRQAKAETAEVEKPPAPPGPPAPPPAPPAPPPSLAPTEASEAHRASPVDHTAASPQPPVSASPPIPPPPLPSPPVSSSRPGERAGKTSSELPAAPPSKVSKSPAASSPGPASSAPPVKGPPAAPPKPVALGEGARPRDGGQSAAEIPTMPMPRRTAPVETQRPPSPATPPTPLSPPFPVAPVAPSAETPADLATSAHEISQLVAKGNLQEAMAQLETIRSQQAESDGSPAPATGRAGRGPGAASAKAQAPTNAPNAGPWIGSPAEGPGPEPRAPEEQTLSRKAVAEPPSRHRGPSRRPSAWLLLAGGAGLLIAVVAVGWMLGGRKAPEEPVADAIPEPPKPRIETPADIPPPPTGIVTIDARPWGEIVEISNSDGYLLGLPAVTHTPVVLALEPGLYRIQVARESVAEPSLCEVEVDLEVPAACEVVFGSATAIEYFKDSGWWK